MARAVPAVLIALVALLAPCNTAAEPEWPRFRGPNGQGVAPGGCKPPADFGTESNVAWKADLPPGHSSPVVAGDKIFLTALDEGRLVTLCVDAASGKVRWSRAAPAKKVEKAHPSGSPASSTPVTDGDNVYAYFGSCGLVAYDAEGRELWSRPLPQPASMFGSASSPILVGDNVVLVCDTDAGESCLVATDRRTGAPAWKTARPLFKASWSTPALWEHDGVEELIVLGSGRMMAYDASTGAERWWVAGFPQQAITVPATGAGLLFAAKGGQGDPGQSITSEIPKWDVMLREHDRNRDGKLAADEFDEGEGFHLRKEIPKDSPGNFLPMRTLIGMIDGNKDGAAGRFEWAIAVTFLTSNEDVLLAVRPGGDGDATDTHVAWKQRRAIPEIPSPLFYDGRLYLVKNGGIVTCLDPQTGRTIYRERLGAGGQYAASPVAADGRIYVVSEPGVVSVLKAGDTFAVMSENDLAERTMATPAIAGNTLYVRTDRHLFAFRNNGK
jgi:outer membrane protein assembly factor BamB